MPKKVPKKGFYWHVHHKVLLEWCYDYDKRVEFIRVKKYKSELDLRLKLFQPIKGELPKEFVRAGQAYNKAWQADNDMCQVYDKVKQALYKAEQTYDVNQSKKNKDKVKVLRQAYNKAARAHDRMWQVYNQAKQVYRNALTNNTKLINKLHSLECPNCPWGGETIFP